MSFKITPKELYRQIMLELALSVSGMHEEQELLTNISRLYLKKLQCRRVLIAKQKEGGLEMMLNIPPTKNDIGWKYAFEEMKVRAAKYHTKRFCEIPYNDEQFYGFRLGTYGILIIENHYKWPDLMLHELVGVVDAWGNALSLSVEIDKRIKAEQELSNQFKMLQIMLESASTHINTSLLEIDAAIHESIVSVSQFLGADRGYIFEYNWQDRLTSNTHEWCAHGIEPEIDNLQDVPMDMVKQWVDTHSKGGTMVVESLECLTDNNLKEILGAQGIKSLIALPLMHKDQCLGFVGFDFTKKGRSFHEKEQSLLKMFASILVNVELRIREDKRAMQYRSELEKSRTRFRNLVERINDVVFILNSATELTYVSPNYSELMGFHPHDKDGHYPMKVVHNDDRKKLEVNVQKVLNRQLKKVRMECRVIDKRGRVKIHNLSLTANEIVNGRVISIAGTATDITPEKEFQKSLITSRNKERDLLNQYKAILNNSSVSILKLTTTGKIIYLNECYSDRLGFGSYAEGLQYLVGNVLSDCLLADEQDVFKEKLEQVVSKDRERQFLITREKTVKGSIIGSRWELSQSKSQDGKLSEVLLIGFDVTEQIKSLVRTYELVDQRDRLRENERHYSYLLSHNLRRHSANIQGISHILAEKRLALNGDAGMLNMLEKSAVDLDVNIRRLSSMLDMGDMAKTQIFKVKPFLEKLLIGFSRKFETVNAKVKLNVNSSDSIDADPHLLEEIVKSSVSNAIKFRKKENALQIEFHFIKEKDCLIVKDNGQGMKEELLNSIFTMLNGAKPNLDATQFGLFLNKIKMEAMQGTFDVSSVYGEGTVISLTFGNAKRFSGNKDTLMNSRTTQEIKLLNKTFEHAHTNSE